MHVKYARANPGTPPNIDRLFAPLEKNRTLRTWHVFAV
ncbi:MAG TPA: DUF2322 family protein [Accumulibacter sp.]|uniref:Uncharacterized protein n=1 Tax=Candidatus Accumulibacter phosphatis TaxID=327160 RepID=A0A5S4ER75_9PROT|nr:MULTISPECIES: DUF2322 family protein [Candidatus Accumulibacter]MCC2868055.1 DUF2322 family protein [Candidatus Accumulibacter phosphatis]MCM8581155.1 DUF2322 family protein [Accumulibacter sp.]MCM8624014.1 DUF2322 family protein [Accumulibacter sp.]TMQ77986.1 hypothetical protein ACCUM_2437 [Candidatus Accumulibacter phosphatis]HMW56923.1 DUF2322 family protein [Accumulibacter sp.]